MLNVFVFLFASFSLMLSAQSLFQQYFMISIFHSAGDLDDKFHEWAFKLLEKSMKPLYEKCYKVKLKDLVNFGSIIIMSAVFPHFSFRIFRVFLL